MITQALIRSKIKKVHSESPREFKVEFEDNDFVVGDVVVEMELVAPVKFKITAEEGEVYTLNLLEPDKVNTLDPSMVYSPRNAQHPFDLLTPSDTNPRKEIVDPDLSEYPLFRDRILVRPIENQESIWLFQGANGEVKFNPKPAWCKILKVGPWVGSNNTMPVGYEAPKVGDLALTFPNRMECDVMLDGKAYSIFTEQSIIMSYRPADTRVQTTDKSISLN